MLLKKLKKKWREAKRVLGSSSSKSTAPGASATPREIDKMIAGEPISAIESEGLTFDACLQILREKWQEAPGGSDMGERVFSSDVLSSFDPINLLQWWTQQIEAGAELRGWYWRLYSEVFRGKRVLEIGSGLGFDAITFSRHGAHWTCCDIAPSNLQIIEKIAEAYSVNINTVLIESLQSFDLLPSDFDFIWCNGSLINLPFNLARHECAAILPHLKIGGRWIELAYPRERWIREGSVAFAMWGRMTDGERTPWMEWYDIERLKERLAPFQFIPVLETRFSSDSYIWLDMELTGRSEFPDGIRKYLPLEDELLRTPPFLWSQSKEIDIFLGEIGPGITAEIVLTVEQGSVAIALKKDGNFASRELIVEERRGSQLIYLSTREASTGLRLSVRNGSGLGESAFRLHSVALRLSW